VEIWLARFGILSVFAGTFLEGETVLVAAGVLAHAGRLHLPPVITAAFLGAWTGHLLWFYLGRSRGPALLLRWPRLQRGFDRVEPLIHRFGTAAIFITQYLYGARWTAAVAFGMSRLSFRWFALMQVANCLIWAVVITSLGYFFGEAAARVLGRAAHYEAIALGILVVGAIVTGVIHVLRGSKTVVNDREP